MHTSLALVDPNGKTARGPEQTRRPLAVAGGSDEIASFDSTP
jgi:hypothetical protein